MRGFPPAPEDQVSLANWREAPFNGWSFRHVREIIPTADIAHDPHQSRPLPIGLVDTNKIRILGEGAVLSRSTISSRRQARTACSFSTADASSLSDMPAG
jgi:hypothetical protein